MAFNTIGSNEFREDENRSEEADDASKIKDIPSIFASDLTSFNRGECISFSIIVVFLCILSVAGNIGALYANQKRKLRLFFRTCLTSLALSDLIQTVFMSAGYLAQFGAPYVQVWCLGELMCIFIPFVTTGAVLVGSMTLVGIAMDRYFAVMSSVLGAWNPSKTFCSVSAICVWALSYGIASPMLSAYSINFVYILESKESDIESNQPEIIGINLVEMCVSDKTSNAYYYIVVLAIIFIPTLVAFIWLNSIIANKLWIRRRFISVPAASSRLGQNEALPAAPTATSLSIAVGANRKPEEKQLEMTQQQYDHPCHCHGGNKICSYSTLTVPTRSMVATTTMTVTTTTTTTLMKSLETNNLKSNSNTGGNSAKHISSREARHLRMFTIVLILMAVFIFFRLPAWVFLIMRMYGTYTHPVHWILHFSFGILTLASCVLNPLLYTFLAETIQYTMLMKGKLCGLRRYFENCGPNQENSSSHCCNSNNDKNNDKMSQIQKQLQNTNNDNGHYDDDDDVDKDDGCCKNGTSNDGAKSTLRIRDDESNAKVYTIMPVLQKKIHAT